MLAGHKANDLKGIKVAPFLMHFLQLPFFWLKNFKGEIKQSSRLLKAYVPIFLLAKAFLSVTSKGKNQKS